MKDSFGRYTHGHEKSTLASHSKRTAWNSCAYFLPLLSSGMSVLDVGCGPGTISLDLAKLVSPGKVVGIENVEEPIQSAKREAELRGDDQTEFKLGDVYNIDYQNNTFDVVHAHQVLQHLTNPVEALREMLRVVKIGGIVAVRECDYAAMTWYPEFEFLNLWQSTYRSIAKNNGAEPDAGRRLRSWALGAGAKEPILSASVWSYSDQETCAWWGESQSNRCNGERFRTQAKEQGISDFQIQGIVNSWREWGRHPEACFHMVHGELIIRKTEFEIIHG